MPNYQQSKIYKIWSPSKNLVYYGSTTQTIAQRLTKHKSAHKIYNQDNNKVYCSSYLILDCEDYKIELIEECSYNNKSQLSKKEGEYIKNNECVNKQIAGRTKIEYDKEYKINNIEAQKEYAKEWYKNNKEKRREYIEANREKINEKCRERHKLNKKEEIK